MFLLAQSQKMLTSNGGKNSASFNSDIVAFLKKND